MFGMSHRSQGNHPPKGDWPVGDLITKEKFIETAYAVLQEMIGEREKNIARKEAKIGEMERICRTCLSAIQDTNPNLSKTLREEFDEVFK